MKKIISLVSLILVFTIYSESKMQEPYKLYDAGKFEIKKSSYLESMIIINNQMIKKVENPYVQLLEKFHFKDSSVFIVVENANGSNTPNEYYIIEVYKNKKFTITESISPPQDIFMTKKVNNRLIIDMGLKDKSKYYAIYENGVFRTFMDSHIEVETDDQDCRYLYNIYSEAHRGNKDADCDIVLSGSDRKNIIHLSHSPNFNIKRLEIMSKQLCKDRLIDYTLFKKTICTSNINTAY